VPVCWLFLLFILLKRISCANKQTSAFDLISHGRFVVLFRYRSSGAQKQCRWKKINRDKRERKRESETEIPTMSANITLDHDPTSLLCVTIARFFIFLEL
jgi:hypothetical protein